MTEKTARLLVCLKMVVMSMVTLSAAMPQTGSEHITLQLQPEMLREHRLVLTIEPLLNPSTRSPNTAKSLNNNFSNNTREADDDSTITTTTDENYELASTTSVPDITTETSEGVTATLVSPIISKTPFYLDSNVEGLLLTFPDVFCPQGFRPDPSGRCRPTFFRPPVTRGRSISEGYFGSLPFHGYMGAQGNSLFKASKRLYPESKNKVYEG